MFVPGEAEVQFVAVTAEIAVTTNNQQPTTNNHSRPPNVKTTPVLTPPKRCDNPVVLF
jgi:hypothetical protein